MSELVTFLVQVALFSLGWHLLDVRWGEWRKIGGAVLMLVTAAVSVSFQ